MVLADALDTAARAAVAEAAAHTARIGQAAVVVADQARRHQDQARRQLGLVDELAGTTGPAQTRLLHLLAHQVRSGRRQAESLLVLTGTADPATRTAPVAFDRVVAAALSEIDEPARVAVAGLGPAAVAGSVAADLAHIVAELVANGLIAAGPAGPVTVTGTWHPDRYLLAVADTGPDLSPERLAVLNARVAPGPTGSDHPLHDLLSHRTVSTSAGPTGTARQRSAEPHGPIPLGLAVIRHLATQHGLLVRFRARAGGGVQAEVGVPRGLALPPPGPTTMAVSVRATSRSTAGG